MQVHRFSNGGCVIHKITPHGYKGRASAWFSAGGVMMDVEAFDSHGRTRHVIRNGGHWRAIERAARPAVVASLHDAEYAVTLDKISKGLASGKYSGLA